MYKELINSVLSTAQDFALNSLKGGYKEGGGVREGKKRSRGEEESVGFARLRSESELPRSC